MALRRADQCAICSASLPLGIMAAWDRQSRLVRCVACAHGASAEQADAPTAAAADSPRSVTSDVGGASAQREYERRTRRREERTRTRHPRLGGLILALSDEPT